LSKRIVITTKKTRKLTNIPHLIQKASTNEY
jgi:hypothetical protein